MVVENLDTCIWRPPTRPELVWRPNYTVPVAANMTGATMGFVARARALPSGGRRRGRVRVGHRERGRNALPHIPHRRTGPGGRVGADRPLRHLHRRHDVPRGRPRDGRGARAARPRGRLPRRSRPAAARCTRTAATPTTRATSPAVRRGLRRLRGASCRRRRRASGRARALPRLLGVTTPCSSASFELSELLVSRLGVDDVGATFPHRVAYHPTCHSLRVTRVGDAPLRLLRQRPRARARRARPARRSAAASAARSRSRTPRRRARSSPTSATHIEATRRRGLHRARRLVPAPDRRRPLAPRLARARDPPRGDPRVAMKAPARDLSRGRATRELANPQLRANLRNATDDDPRQARARGRRAAGLGGAARGRSRDQGGRARATSTSTSSQFEAAVEAAGGHVHWARDARRGERDRRRGRPGARGRPRS